MAGIERPVSMLEARSIITSINRLNLELADYDHLARRVGRLITGVPLSGTVIKPGLRLYRGRKSRHKLMRLSDLGAPPAAAVINYQRCNSPNDPMFYCATHQATACYELNASVGEFVYISCWHVNIEFLTQVIPPDRMRSHNHARLAMIATFFETKFSQPIHDTFSSQYKITSAIADRLTAKEFNLIPPTAAPSREAYLHGVRCLLYPSVAHPKEAECLAMRPQIVERCLELSYVEEWQIAAVGVGEVTIQRVDSSSSFDRGGIKWTGKPLHWNLKEAGQMVTATAEPDGWVLRNPDGTLVKPC